MRDSNSKAAVRNQEAKMESRILGVRRSGDEAREEMREEKIKMDDKTIAPGSLLAHLLLKPYE